jgi:transglutaminase-like putative cysteine protease
MKMDRLIDDDVESENSVPWLFRLLVAMEAWARPMWGWGVLIACMLLSMLPAVALRANRWLALGGFQQTLEIAGPLAVATVWTLWGWRQPQRERFGWRGAIWTGIVGIVLLSQLLLGWLPGLGSLWQASGSGAWQQLFSEMRAEWTQAGARFILWGQGVASGGAAQDNLVFATVGSLILWGVGAMTAWLARRTQQGFAAGALSLWLLGGILLYSDMGRYLLIVALALMIALHILLEQGKLMNRWQQLRLDYSPGLLMDRALLVLSTGGLVLVIAALMPNLYIRPLVMQYYTFLAPVHASMERMGERLFPELQGTSRLRGGSGSGMPNEFLLQGGPNLGTAVVMRVRTDEAAPYPYQFPYDEMAPPPHHYMRGGTLTLYDGHGWSNSPGIKRQELDANERWDQVSVWGRKPVVQSVIMEQSSSTLYAAPEAVEISVDARLSMRGTDDQVTWSADESSYTVVSMVPAVDEAMLREMPWWGEGNPLPTEFETHLALPEAVTERTRELAQQIVADQVTAYDKAFAIEQYLRQYTYDLDVAEPPDDVVEMADYFMFELQRGYCDYYATAFVVLARLSGLPTRFSTGFAAGQWDPMEGVWVIREADAHSWPEVYFPQVGWIAFEPTAARATLVRSALPQAADMGAVSPPVAIPPATVSSEEAVWNWQMLIWLVPMLGVVWGVVVGWRMWLRHREDPWSAVLQWGSKVGRPIHAGETVLEYGRDLAGYVLARQTRTPDSGRIAAREIQAVSEDVNRIQYGPADERLTAQRSMEDRWTRLRSYLAMVRF